MNVARLHGTVLTSMLTWVLAQLLKLKRDSRKNEAGYLEAVSLQMM